MERCELLREPKKRSKKVQCGNRGMRRVEAETSLGVCAQQSRGNNPHHGTSVCLSAGWVQSTTHSPPRTRSGRQLGPLSTDGEMEASEAEVPPWSLSKQGPVPWSDAQLRAPPASVHRADTHTSTSVSWETGHENRRGCKGERNLQILPRGRQQKLLTSLQDTTKLEEAFE